MLCWLRSLPQHLRIGCYYYCFGGVGLICFFCFQQDTCFFFSLACGQSKTQDMMHKCYHTGAVFVRQALQNCDCLHLVTKHLFLPEAVQLPQMGQSSALIGTMHCGVPTPMLAFPVPWHFLDNKLELHTWSFLNF